MTPKQWQWWLIVVVVTIVVGTFHVSFLISVEDNAPDNTGSNSRYTGQCDFNRVVTEIVGAKLFAFIDS